MRIRALILALAVAATAASMVAVVEPSGAILSDPDVCQNPKDPPKNAKRITGTPGNDVIYGTDGNDIIRGLTGNDTIYGGKGNDMICGGGDNDRIYGGKARDRMWGNYGNDWFDAGGGDDQVDGGADGDTISFESAPAGVKVNTAFRTYRVGKGPTERVTGVFAIIGSNYNDYIDVSHDNTRNAVFARGGNDKIVIDSYYPSSPEVVWGEGGYNECSFDGRNWSDCKGPWWPF